MPKKPILRRAHLAQLALGVCSLALLASHRASPQVDTYPNKPTPIVMA